MSQTRLYLSIATGIIIVAMSIATMLALTILNNALTQSSLERQRVTLCILLEPAESRTREFVQDCVDNPPMFEDLPRTVTTTEGG